MCFLTLVTIAGEPLLHLTFIQSFIPPIAQLFSCLLALISMGFLFYRRQGKILGES